MVVQQSKQAEEECADQIKLLPIDGIVMEGGGESFAMRGDIMLSVMADGEPSYFVVSSRNLSELRKQYPAVHITNELKQIKKWLMYPETKSRDKFTMGRTIRRWLNKVEDQILHEKVIDFPVTGVGNPVFVVTRTLCNKWQELYPSIDIENELEKLKEWYLRDETQYKTREAIPAYLKAMLVKKHNNSDFSGSSSIPRQCDRGWMDELRNDVFLGLVVEPDNDNLKKELGLVQSEN
ncbi:hypothetical protein Q9L42_021250 (plasmid) [Methylomarinum sp. Ch1-1]|uniref:Uncharacterized protein n=1 Tax=Methylomarinum roseum TaxID=3067653 RepID=A0AAU7P0V5_9GAMM|nr:hypothetical protein [Methylomarinum sp. Ch1-1]MDP4523189.1 hypothetical protein [Methylomarinum sp. Ch1-1]